MDRRLKVMQNFLGKSADAGTNKTRCFTDGKKIWSYGRHFVMAEWTDVRDSQGNEILLVNRERYSVTTSKMQGELRGQIRRTLYGRVIYHTDHNPLRYYLENAVSAVKGVRRAIEYVEDPEEHFHKCIEELRGAVAESETLRSISGQAAYHMDTYDKLLDFSLEDCRNKIRGGMDSELEAVIYLMAVKGPEAYADEIAKMPIQYAIVYKMLGGKLELKKQVKNELWNYLWLKDHCTTDEAVKYVTSSSPAIRKIACRILEKGDAA